MSISSSVGVPGDNANTVEGDADSAGGAEGAEWASRKQNFAAVFGDSDNGSGGEEEAGRASKKQNLAAVLGGKDGSKEACLSKRSKKARK